MRTIAHISDIHFGRIDPPIVEAVVREINDRNPSLVVVSGDLTQRARAWQYRDAASFLKRWPQPQIVVPGNHDIPLYDLFRRAFFPLQFYQRHISKELRPLYRDEEIIVVGLNSARPLTFRINGFWKDGKIDAYQLDDLRDLMRDVPESVFKIVVTHHPFIPPSLQAAGEIVHGATKALAVMEQCGVDLLLAGHLHMGYCGDVRTHHEEVKRSILSVQAGTATSTRRRGGCNAYNWITIAPDDVRIDVRTWNETRFENSITNRFVRSDGMWQAGPSGPGISERGPS